MLFRFYIYGFGVSWWKDKPVYGLGARREIIIGRKSKHEPSTRGVHDFTTVILRKFLFFKLIHTESVVRQRNSDFQKLVYGIKYDASILDKLSELFLYPDKVEKVLSRSPDNVTISIWGQIPIYWSIYISRVKLIPKTILHEFHQGLFPWKYARGSFDFDRACAPNGVNFENRMRWQRMHKAMTGGKLRNQLNIWHENFRWWKLKRRAWTPTYKLARKLR